MGQRPGTRVQSQVHAALRPRGRCKGVKRLLGLPAAPHLGGGAPCALPCGFALRVLYLSAWSRVWRRACGGLLTAARWTRRCSWLALRRLLTTATAERLWGRWVPWLGARCFCCGVMLPFRLGHACDADALILLDPGFCRFCAARAACACLYVACTCLCVPVRAAVCPPLLV